jgi:hypothetical protein
MSENVVWAPSPRFDLGGILQVAALPTVGRPIAERVEVGLVSNPHAIRTRPLRIDGIVRAHDHAGFVDPEGGGDVADVVDLCDAEVGVDE